MLNLTFIRNQTNEAIERLQKRNLPAQVIISKILEADETRRRAQAQYEELKRKLNKLSEEVGIKMKLGDHSAAEIIKADVSILKPQIQELENKLREAESVLQEILISTPNLPHSSVIKGMDSSDNQIIRQYGKIPNSSDKVLPHWDLAKKFNLIDFDAGVKITGSGFPVYVNQGARLQRALIQFFLDTAVAAGYKEYQTPYVVNPASGFGTGQLPDKEGQMYHISQDDLYLIPTAEVPLTNLFRETILTEDDLPIRLTAYSPCFRREAGSYGKDVRGLNRLHQFDKVEIVQIVHPEKSYEVLQEMLNHVSMILEKLELPYRILKLCGGDLGFASAMTFDFETYSAAQNRWLEVSSTSNFETFQSLRMKLRFKNKEGKILSPHTLNGSALALPRVLASLLEYNQAEDHIRLPHCIHNYFGNDRITLP